MRSKFSFIYRTPASVWMYSGSLPRIHRSLLRYHTVSRRVYRLRGIDYRHDSYTILPQQPQIGLWLILSCDLERWTLWYQQCDAHHAPGRLPVVWSRSGLHVPRLIFVVCMPSHNLLLSHYLAHLCAAGSCIMFLDHAYRVAG